MTRLTRDELPNAERRPCVCGHKLTEHWHRPEPSDCSVCECNRYMSLIGVWLDRPAPHSLTGINGADDTDFRYVTWRDFATACACRPVPAPDGTFGWVIQRCEEHKP